MADPDSFKLVNVLESIAVTVTALQRSFRYVLQNYYTAEKNYHRAAKLKAYKLRKKWKSGDKAKVEILEPNPVVVRRLANVKGRGRPVVADYVPLGENVASVLLKFTGIFASDLSTHDRIKLLKKSRWCDMFIEAVYSGELAAARATKVGDASGHARDCTAQAFAINRDAVKDAVARARVERQGELWSKDDTMLIKDLKHWQRTGELPKFLQE